MGYRNESNLLAALAVIAIASSASAVLAADLYVDSPVVAVEAASDWSGPYIGVQAGVVSLTTSENYDPEYSTPYDPYWELGGVGASVGLFVGYDVQLSDMFVLGVSAEGNYVNTAIENDGYDDYLTMNWDAALKVRAGMLINPSTLVYGTVGYSVADFSLSDDTGATTTPSNPLTVGSEVLVSKPRLAKTCSCALKRRRHSMVTLM